MRRISLVISLLILGASTASSQQRDRLALQDFLDYEQVRDFFRGGGPIISPDGKQVVYTRWWVDKMNDRWKSSLWLMLTLLSLAAQGCSQVKQTTYATPEAAAEALVGAAEKYDIPTLQQILGKEGMDLVVTEDTVQDRNIMSASGRPIPLGEPPP